VKGSGPCHVNKWRIDVRGEDGTGGDTLGGGPHNNTIPFWNPPLIKGRTKKGVQNHLSVIDLGALILTIERCAPNSIPPPPPFVKDRMTRGVQNETSAADLGGQILIVQTCLLVKMTLPLGKYPVHDFVLTQTIAYIKLPTALAYGTQDMSSSSSCVLGH
jgi:hypothetical protein